MAVPIYRELSQKIEKYIIANNIRGRLPGTRKLSAEFGVHHVTLLKALHLLEQKGILSIDPARGVFTDFPAERKRHNVIALISANLEQPGNREMQSVLEKHLSGSGYNLIGICFDSDLFENNKRLLLNFPVDGFIFRGSSLRDAQAELLLKEKIPFVSCSKRKDLPQIDQIDCDHTSGYSLLLEQLMAMGHRRIAFCEFGRIPEYRFYLNDIYSLFSKKLGSSFDSEYFYVRETGLDLWKKFGEEYWNIYTGKAAEYFCSLKNPPSAIVAPYPLLSRIHKHLCARGVNVPQDISLASMNYSKEGSSEIDFTRIVYDETKMLCQGADRLLAKLADYSLSPESTFHKPVFIAGETVAPPLKK